MRVLVIVFFLAIWYICLRDCGADDLTPFEHNDAEPFSITSPKSPVKMMISKNIAREWGDLIRRYREATELTQGQLGEEVFGNKVGGNRISKWESGNFSMKPKFQDIATAQRILGFREDEIPDWNEKDDDLAEAETTVKRRLRPINGDTLDERFKRERRKFFLCCKIVTSVPGQIILSGEKVAAGGVPGIAMTVPRRVYVGLAPRNDGALVIERSVILDESTSSHDRFPVGPIDHEPTFDPGNMIQALACTSEALFKQTGVRRGYNIRIWTEWKSETGLSWSGAFSVALASGLHLGNEKITSKNEIWKSPSVVSEDTQSVIRLGWITEACLHAGKSSGMAVCFPAFGGKIPFLYKAEGIPKLWAFTQEEENPTKNEFFESDVIRNTQYTKFFDYPDNAWSITRISEGVGMDENVISRLLFAQLSVLVVHTGTIKSTGKTNEAEFKRIANDRQRDREHQIYPGLREILKNISAKNASDFHRLTRELSMANLSTNNFEKIWAEIIENLGSISRILSTLGFTFGDAEEILGALRACISQEPSSDGDFNTVLGDGKTTGAGTGGNLIFLVFHRTTDIKDRLYGVIDRLRDQRNNVIGQKTSSISIMFDSGIDGFEATGLRIEKSP